VTILINKKWNFVLFSWKIDDTTNNSNVRHVNLHGTDYFNIQRVIRGGVDSTSVLYYHRQFGLIGIYFGNCELWSQIQ
jgi:hypothetical protein